MQSPLKRISVFDLETGGFFWKYNSITEFAGVAVEIETLEIVEEFSVMIRPRLDLSYTNPEPLKEAKTIFKNLAEKDPDTNIKTIQYKGKSITLKSLETLAEDIREFYEDFLGDHGNIITYEDYLALKESKHADIAELYFTHTYSPGALEATHITREMLLEEGVEYEEAFKQIQEFFQRHTVGNGKPIIAGHNIKTFDNDFMVKLFADHKHDFFKSVNSMVIDTLEWARLRWFELPDFKLSTCANAVGLTLKEAHRALPDTVANAKFLIKILKSMRGEGSQESTYVRKKYELNF